MIGTVSRYLHHVLRLRAGWSLAITQIVGSGHRSLRLRGEQFSRPRIVASARLDEETIFKDVTGRAYVLQSGLPMRPPLVWAVHLADAFRNVMPGQAILLDVHCTSGR